MTTPIHDYPPVEQKYVAVRRFKLSISPRIFERLLERLELTEKEFVQEYGEKLMGNPALLNHEVTEMIISDLRRVRHYD